MAFPKRKACALPAGAQSTDFTTGNRHQCTFPYSFLPLCNLVNVLDFSIEQRRRLGTRFSKLNSPTALARSWWGKEMALYQFRLSRNGEDDEQQVDQELADDLAAFKTAEALSLDFDV